METLNKFFNEFYNYKNIIREEVLNILSLLYIRIYLISLLFINLLVWYGAFYVDINTMDELVALHYSVDFGINLIEKTKFIYIIPLLGSIIILFNFIIIIFTNRLKDKLIISHILLITAFATNVLLLAAIVSIYLINFQY
jgi:hypothetical protein